ncbi:putative sensor-like histidine kinase [Actinoplanes missouriensis 431]|uniref:histidine kinase n=1 Tax=Actinoplanes missouriensis (strain ATCC 14538 / DSM 43046 / CBS 188.64 / JCM 3121 / NBRC 102363 / NCIMB 12654 / NRRL B-3342 / UNCC 431) TaxID=512565 RepID=I0GZQ9_ACTM4|nr:nitrate- and nitrite sensing domain-containing protein [Actinoplanes missouriensis]BAL86246.1 putative sensor-like histidine kinase [Actinoplanes missouriensis 431]
MRSRNWSIRSKITAMVAVPLAALLALWIFATVVTAGPALNLIEARDAVHKLGNPGLQLIAQLQRERHFSAIYVSAAKPTATDLNRERAATDEAATTFRRAVAEADLTESVRTRVDEMLALLDELPETRAGIDDRLIKDVLPVVRDFSAVIDAAFEVSATAAIFFHERVDREVRGLIDALKGLEHLSRVDAMLAGANAAGYIHAINRGILIEDIANSRYLLKSGVEDMPESARGDYSRVITSPAFVDLDIMQNSLIGDSYAGGPPPVSGESWQPTYDRTNAELSDFVLRSVDEVAEDAVPLAASVLLRLGIAGLLGLVAFVLSIFVAVRFGRSIVGRLIRLRREALEMASERLPAVVRRLQRGEAVDVEVETPPLEYGGDEIGQLGHAFNAVQRTAVQSAVDEANVRRGINEVFLNIARRSQTLLHRQLSLLDKMERRETEPQELEDLYRVDHLATRMRRHAEDLVILAGAAPGRGWRNPVPIIDVVRGAISEVEDYKRIDIRTITSSAVLGRAVGDVIHLLAELIENAASYSPPHARVQVVGQVLPNGYAIEIEDRGLGMAPEAIEETNRRLAEPPDFDPTDSARLGLFVVAQLANRHQIRVSLRASAYGGITAIVLLPGDLVTSVPGPALPIGPASGGLDTPLVGSGSEDPLRQSLASLQWQGTGELREVTVPGRRGAAEETPADAVTDPGGPAPSLIADELSAEGLVQRRRVRRKPNPPIEMPGESTGGIRAVPRNSGPSAPPPETPVVPAQRRPSAAETTDDDGLPKRVRQASLAPQLRQPAVEQESTAPARSPEQVRTLMSALQLGTNRGRVDAARTETAAAETERADDTVSFPTLVDVTAARDNAPSGTDAADGDRAYGTGENLRLEKDA